MALHQQVRIELGRPWSALDHHSVATVRCSECPHEFLAAVEYGYPRGLVDPDDAVRRLLDHARQTPDQHPELLGEVNDVPLPRSA